MANPATNVGHQLILQRPDLVHRAWIPTLVRSGELLLCARSKIVVMTMLLVGYFCKVKHTNFKKQLFSTTKISEPTLHQP